MMHAGARMAPVFAPVTRGRTVVRGRHKDHLFSVELLKEEDALPRPIWYKTHKAQLVDALDYDYVSRVTGADRTLERDVSYGILPQFHYASS